MKEFRCTCNAQYSHNCLGRDDLTARQGHYIRAESAEEARQIMALRYPEDAEAGFTVEEFERFNVIIREVKSNDL